MQSNVSWMSTQTFEYPLRFYTNGGAPLMRAATDTMRPNAATLVAADALGARARVHCVRPTQTPDVLYIE